MEIDQEKLITQLSSNEANERMAGIRYLQEDLSYKKPDLSIDIMQMLNRIALSDKNNIVKSEAMRLLERDEYIALLNRMGIDIPSAKPIIFSGESKPTILSLSKRWKIIFTGLIILTILAFFANIYFIFDISSHYCEAGICIPFYCICFISLICMVSFWVLLYNRWHAGWRKIILVLLSIISLIPPMFLFYLYKSNA